MIKICIGIAIGAMIGIFGTALAVAASRADRLAEKCEEETH